MHKLGINIYILVSIEGLYRNYRNREQLLSELKIDITEKGYQPNSQQYLVSSQELD